MRKSTIIFVALSLALSAQAAVDVVLGRLSDLTWLAGDGNNRVAVWSSVSPVARTDFGAWMHLDASYAAGMSNIVENGTNFVYQWSDWRENGTYARRDATYPGMPHVSAGAQNGKSIIEFKPYSVVDTSLTGANLKFVSEQTGICAVFAVINRADYADNSFFLGGTSTYDFHGGVAGRLFDGVYASPRILNGTNALDGVSTAADAMWPTNIFHVVSIRTAGGPVTANNIGRDRSYRFGGIDFAELLIFTNGVSDAVTAEITSYLGAKWGIPVTR